MSAFDDLNTISPIQIWPGLLARPLEGVNSTLAAIEIEPDVDVPEHAHANEQIGVLTGGSVRFRIGGEEQELRPGATWVIPPDVPHSVRSGPEGATLIELFAPARDDWADRERLAPTPPVRLG